MPFKVDTSKLLKKLEIYGKVSHKDGEEVLNKVGFDVAIQWVKLMHHSDKEGIEAELRKNADIASAPLADILVNKKRGDQGLPGWNGAKMTAAIEKLIRERKRSTNFVRSGALAAVKKLAPYAKKSTTGVGGVKIIGRDKGGATPARSSNWKMNVEFWNSVQGGKQESSYVRNIEEEGLQAALDAKEADIVVYLVRKMKLNADAFNRT